MIQCLAAGAVATATAAARRPCGGGSGGAIAATPAAATAAATAAAAAARAAPASSQSQVDGRPPLPPPPPQPQPPPLLPPLPSLPPLTTATSCPSPIGAAAGSFVAMRFPRPPPPDSSPAEGTAGARRPSPTGLGVLGSEEAAAAVARAASNTAQLPDGLHPGCNAGGREGGRGARTVHHRRPVVDRVRADVAPHVAQRRRRRGGRAPRGWVCSSLASPSPLMPLPPRRHVRRVRFLLLLHADPVTAAATPHTSAAGRPPKAVTPLRAGRGGDDGFLVRSCSHEASQWR